VRKKLAVGVVKGLTKALLMGVGAGAVIGVGLAFPGIGLLYKEFKKGQWEAAKRRGLLRSTIRRLEKQKLISWQERNNELILNLTENGKKKVLSYQIDNLQLKTPDRWDGFFRVIVFDIPEDKKMAREIFRNKLKYMGFTKLQKSVFLTRLECKDEIDFLRHALEIASYVVYIRAKEISGLEVRN